MERRIEIGKPRIRNERGVTYLMLMFAIVLIGIATTAAAKQWKVIVQRERERWPRSGGRPQGCCLT